MNLKIKIITINLIKYKKNKLKFNSSVILKIFTESVALRLLRVKYGVQYVQRVKTATTRWNPLQPQFWLLHLLANHGSQIKILLQGSKSITTTYSVAQTIA